MKKVLIVLLSVLLALTFISCEKDKSGEVIQNYEDFTNTYNAYSKVRNIYSTLEKIGTWEYDESGNRTLDIEFSDSDITKVQEILKNNSYYVGRILDVDNYNPIYITITSVGSVSGKLEGKIQSSSSQYNEEYTASDIVIKFKYTTTKYVEDSKTGEYNPETSDSIDAELKINFKYSQKSTKDAATYSISSLSLQNVSYKDIEYSEGKEGYTSATVGGTAVELRLIEPYLEKMN